MAFPQNFAFPYYSPPPPHYIPSPPTLSPPPPPHHIPTLPPPPRFPATPPPPPHHTPTPPPSHSAPPPPRHSAPPPSHSAPPPPRHPAPPPPHHHIPPPPPHVSPSPPAPPPHVIPIPPSPGHHTTVIVVVFVSLGGLFFLAFLSVALFCFINRRKKRAVHETDRVRVDEYVRVQEAIVPGPHGTEVKILSIDEDVHVEEEIKKSETVGAFSHLKKSAKHHPPPQALDIASATSQSILKDINTKADHKSST